MKEGAITGNSESKSHFENDEDDGGEHGTDDQDDEYETRNDEDDGGEHGTDDQDDECETRNDEVWKELKVTTKTPIVEDVSNNYFKIEKVSSAAKSDDSDNRTGSVTPEVEYIDVCVQDEKQCGCQDAAYESADDEFANKTSKNKNKRVRRMHKGKGCSASGFKSSKANKGHLGARDIRADVAKNWTFQSLDRLEKNLMVKKAHCIKPKKKSKRHFTPKVKSVNKYSRHGFDLTSIDDWAPFYQRYKGIFEDDNQSNKYCGVSGCCKHMSNVYRLFTTTAFRNSLNRIPLQNEEMKKEVLDTK